MINPQKVNPGKTYTRKEAVKKMQISQASFTKYFLGQVPEIKSTDKRVVYSGLSLNEQIDNLKSNKTVYTIANSIIPRKILDQAESWPIYAPDDAVKEHQKANEGKELKDNVISIPVWSIVDNPKKGIQLGTQITTINFELNNLSKNDIIDIFKQFHNLEVNNQDMDNLFINYAEARKELVGYSVRYLNLNKDNTIALFVVPSLLSNLYTELFNYHKLNKDLLITTLTILADKDDQIAYLMSMQAALTDYYKQWSHINALELDLMQAKAIMPDKKWSIYMKDEGFKKYYQKHISPADDLAYVSDLLKYTESNAIAYNQVRYSEA